MRITAFCFWHKNFVLPLTQVIISADYDTTLHDRLFKEFLTRFLPDFLTLFFPDKAAHLNFDTLTFLDKELIINLPEQVLRIPDIVAEVETWQGEPEAIIVHLEVESRDKLSLPQRLSEYYTLIRVLRRKPVLPLALVLLPKVGGLEWKSYRETLFGEELLRFRYGQVGIRDLPSELYLATGNPVAAALASLMKTKKRDKAAVKLKAFQIIEHSKLSLADQLYLINLIETYLPKGELPPGETKIMTQLAESEMFWSERIMYRAEAKFKAEGEAKGKGEGKLEGKRDLLMRLLALKFGTLPSILVQQLQAVQETAVIDQLSELLLKATHLNEFQSQATPHLAAYEPLKSMV